MAKTEPFDKHADKYEQWFEDNKFIYQSEVMAIKKLMPHFQKGVEIGIGSGRFAFPLGITEGLEPSPEMKALARRKGLAVTKGQAEDMPYQKETFDLALMVTTLCFLDDPVKAFGETFRILKKGGYIIIGFVDKDSRLGRFYQKIKHKNVFYRDAVFYSVPNVIEYLKRAGFSSFVFSQTIFKDTADIKEAEQPRLGYGQGSFAVVRACKPLL